MFVSVPIYRQLQRTLAPLPLLGSGATDGGKVIRLSGVKENPMDDDHLTHVQLAKVEPGSLVLIGPTGTEVEQYFAIAVHRAGEPVCDPLGVIPSRPWRLAVSTGRAFGH
jgi:hypothetical protein